MSQHDYNIANGAGSTVRADINSALAAIRSLNSGTSAPASTTPYTLWVDTAASPPMLKQRDAADAAWVLVGPVSLPSLGMQAASTLAAHATTCNIWADGASTVQLSGSAVTFTNLAAAPNAGAWRRLVMNTAHVLTDNANLKVRGGAHVCAAADVVWVYAETTTTFIMTIEKADGTPVRGVSSVSINGGAAQEGVVNLTGTLVNGLFGNVTIRQRANEYDSIESRYHGIVITTDTVAKEINIHNRIYGSDPGGNSAGDGGSSVHPDSLIEMADGLFKWLRDVRVGDVLRGESGPTVVIGVWRNHLGIRPLCSVGGFVGTPGHLLRLADGRWGAADPESYARNSYGQKRAVKGASGVVMTECLIAVPSDVVKIEPGTVLQTADGTRTVESVATYHVSGADVTMTGNQEVIALHISIGHVFYADGFAVASLA